MASRTIFAGRSTTDQDSRTRYLSDNYRKRRAQFPRSARDSGRLTPAQKPKERKTPRGYPDRVAIYRHQIRGAQPRWRGIKGDPHRGSPKRYVRPSVRPSVALVSWVVGFLAGCVISTPVILNGGYIYRIGHVYT